MFQQNSRVGHTVSGEAPRQVEDGGVRARRSGLGLFFAVTFATTWTFWLTAIALGGSLTSSPTALPFLLGGFGPVFGAIAVRVRRGRRGEPVPARTVKLRQGVRLFWVLPLLALSSASVVAGALLAGFLGDATVSLTEGKELISSVGGIAPFLVSMLIGGPVAEEPGWRGTAYPRLRASMSRLRAGLLLGGVWAVWHLPLFFIEGTVQAELGLFSWSGLMFSLSVFPVALLTGYAYERAGVAAAVAVHLGFNTTMAVLSVDSPVTQASILAVQIGLAITLLATRRDRRTTPHPHQVTADAPHPISLPH
ncbi:CPBP family intramembrane glutamic endopeptidase [Streptomyces liangshanensis]|uniref:CPBP family intramembrane glutamic endopeptidase n=1 Tax=Streptomyces liangshanensis TaxID=2717324 RepID=UPI0036DF0E9A